MTPRRRTPWLFSPATDLGVFVGSAAVALILFALAPRLAPGGDTPEWTWITAVLLVDVAHVWSTAFIVYLDPVERSRRPWLYALTPVAAWLAGMALYARSDVAFWRGLAYLAVFHFVRQQYGWVALYRARGGERDRVGGLVDGAVIYLATLYPLLRWHADLPRPFAWFVDGDFARGLPAVLATVAGVLYVAALIAYTGRAVLQARRGFVSWGKHAVVVTTAACWYLGIVVARGDFAFTVTNVLIHGIPYLALVYVYARAVAREAPRGASARLLRGGVGPFLATVWALAFAEELLWDRGVWHDRAWLFGAGLDVHWHAVLVPLLAVPQITHYLLDGLLWRRRSNPRLARALRRTPFQA